MIIASDGERYENRRSLRQDLSFVALQDFFAQKHIRLEEPQFMTLGLKNHDGIYTNLALLLSDECPHEVKIAVFAGTSKTAPFQNRREFGGSLIAQMQSAYAMLQQYNQIGASGGLVQGLNMDDLKLGVSECLNEKMAAIFYRLQLIEAYGTGIPKIFDSYEGSGLLPKLEASDHAFRITLPNRNFSCNKDITNDISKQKSWLALMQEKKMFTRQDVENAMNVSRSKANNLIKDLVDKGTLIPHGNGKNRYYTIAN